MDGLDERGGPRGPGPGRVPGGDPGDAGGADVLLHRGPRAGELRLDLRASGPDEEVHSPLRGDGRPGEWMIRPAGTTGGEGRADGGGPRLSHGRACSPSQRVEIHVRFRSFHRASSAPVLPTATGLLTDLDLPPVSSVFACFRPDLSMDLSIARPWHPPADRASRLVPCSRRPAGTTAGGCGRLEHCAQIDDLCVDCPCEAGTPEATSRSWNVPRGKRNLTHTSSTRLRAFLSPSVKALSDRLFWPAL